MKRAAYSFGLLLAMGSVALAQAAPPSRSELTDRLVERRAMEAVIWGMPAVNYDLMLQQMLTKTGGKVNQIIYWGRPLDSRNQTLTPNPDAIYFMTFFNTKDAGPIVIEIPPGDAKGSLNGNIVTAWQTPLEDVGLLGIDKGRGGKFVLLPPGYKGKVLYGYTMLHPATNSGFALLRSNLKSHSEADVAASIAYGKRVKIYPLSAADKPPATVFTDVKDVDYDSTIRYDTSFFQSLDRIVQSEPWIQRDRAMIDQLKSLGIEKGKAFNPSEETKTSLAAGVRDAHELLEARYAEGMPPFFSPTSRWTYPAPQALIKEAGSGFADPNQYPTDSRGLVYSYAYIAFKQLGTGQFYLISIRDRDGDAYDGAKTYRLRVPPNPPINQYWSVTAYDRDTHALIKNMTRASRSSQIPEIQKNADGSIDLYFGPQAPAGKEANWVPTDPARKFELMFRAYGPKKEFYDKKWVLPDVAKIELGEGRAVKE